MEATNSWFSKPPPEVLYHYTSQAGLMGIVESKSIWATKLQYLSDAAEFAYAIGLLESEVRQRESKSEGRVRNLLQQVSERLKGIASINIFVCGFSEDGNLLSQWRAYCPPGSGYSIGFHSAALRSSAKRQNFFLGACVYQAGLQRTMLVELLDRAIRDCEMKPEGTQEVADDLIWRFYLLGPFLKNPAFQEEREWRLGSFPIPETDPQIHYREGRSMFIPYFEFHLSDADLPLDLADIYVGPTPHMNLSISSVASYLAKNSVKNRGVRNCLIPYRTW